MSKEIKGTIEELKEVVLDLHRSAALLDHIIQSLEGEKQDDKEYYRLFVVAQARFCGDLKRTREYEKLAERENLIWQKLIENLQKEES